MTRRRKTALVCIGLIIIVVANILLLLHVYLSPARICTRVRRFARERLGCAVEIEAANAGLLGIVELKGIKLWPPGRESGEPAITIERILLDCSPLRLLRGHDGIDEIEVAAPQVRINSELIGSLKDLLSRAGPTPRGRIAKKISIFSGAIGFEEGVLYQGSPQLELSGVRIVVQPTSYSSSQFTFTGGASEPRFGAIRIEGLADLALKSASWSVQVPDVEVGEEFRKLLPESALDVWRDLSPEGHTSVALKVDYSWGDQKLVRPTITASPANCSLRIKEFPIPFTQVGGLMKSDGKVLRVKRGIGRYCSGTVEVRRGFVDKAITEFEMLGRSLPITEELKNSLPPEARSVCEDFGISGGEADAIHRFTLHKGGPRNFPVHSLDVTLRDVKACFDDFPYPVERLGGRIRWETPKQPGAEPSRIHLDLRGTVGKGSVQVDGRIPVPPIVRPQDVEIRYSNGGDSPDVTITARRIQIDQRLRKAVPPEVLAIFDELNLVGNIDVTVMLKLTHNGEKMLITSKSAIVELNGMQANFQRFPYPVTSVVGRVEWDGSMVTLTGVRGLCGKARVAITGCAHIGDASPHPGEKQGIAVAIEGLALEPRFREALNEEGRRIWDDFGPSGNINVFALLGPDDKGKVNVEDLTLTLDHCRATYKGFPYPLESLCGKIELDRDGAITLENISGSAGTGGVRLSGRFVKTRPDPDEKTGENSSLRIQARNIAVDAALQRAMPEKWADVWKKLDPKGSFSGDLGIILPAAGPAGIARGSSVAIHDFSLKGMPLPEAKFLLRTDDKFVYITDFSGSYYGGGVAGAVRLSRKGGGWATHVALNNLDVTQIDNDRDFMPEGKNIRGQLTATLDLAGQGGQTELITGDVEVAVHNGDLGDIPLIADVVMSLLSIGLPKSNTVTGAEIKCRIAESKVDFTSILLKGTTVPITGDGFVKLNGKMKLDFYTSKDKRSIISIIPVAGTFIDSQLIARLRKLIIQAKVEGVYPDVKAEPVAFKGVGNVIIEPIRVLLSVFRSDKKEKNK